LRRAFIAHFERGCRDAFGTGDHQHARSQQANTLLVLQRAQGSDRPFTVQGALPLMGKGSSIVIIGSTASIDPGPGLSVYGATRAALRTLVRSWTMDIKGSGVRINLLSPGPVDTESLRNMLAEHADEVIKALGEKARSVGSE
jgi:NAD(P)-dependent dehydrogenase (short-subunit alcohol dehydrogenase family)